MNEIRTRVPGEDAPRVGGYGACVRRGLVLLVSVLVLGAVVSPWASAATTPKKAPPIAGVTLDGKRLALADLRGKPVVINVWSSW